MAEIIPISFQVDSSPLAKAKAATDQLATSVTKLGGTEKKTSADSRAHADAMKQAAAASKQAAGATKEYDNALKQVSGSVRGMLGPLGSLKGLLTTIGGAFALRSLQTFTMDLQKINMTLQQVTGSTEAAAVEFEYLRRTADKFGQGYMDLGAGYARLLAAAKPANLAIADTRTLFEGVTGAATAYGLASSEVEGILNALQQMLSKGSVQSEELRGQLGERLPGAYQLAAKAMGMTTAELSKQLELGNVAATDFIQKFGKLLKSEFGGFASAADTAAKRTNELENAMSDLKLVIVEGGFQTAFFAVLDFLNVLAQSQSAVMVAQALGATFQVLGVAVQGLTYIFVEFEPAVSAAAVALGIFFAVAKWQMIVKLVGSLLTALVPLIPALAGVAGGMTALGTATLALNPLFALVALVAGAAAYFFLFRDGVVAAGDAINNWAGSIESAAGLATELRSDTFALVEANAQLRAAVILGGQAEQEAAMLAVDAANQRMAKTRERLELELAAVSAHRMQTEAAMLAEAEAHKRLTTQINLETLELAGGYLRGAKGLEAMVAQYGSLDKAVMAHIQRKLDEREALTASETAWLEQATTIADNTAKAEKLTEAEDELGDAIIVTAGEISGMFKLIKAGGEFDTFDELAKGAEVLAREMGMTTAQQKEFNDALKEVSEAEEGTDEYAAAINRVRASLFGAYDDTDKLSTASLAVLTIVDQIAKTNFAAQFSAANSAAIPLLSTVISIATAVSQFAGTIFGSKLVGGGVAPPTVPALPPVNTGKGGGGGGGGSSPYEDALEDLKDLRKEMEAYGRESDRIFTGNGRQIGDMEQAAIDFLDAVRDSGVPVEKVLTAMGETEQSLIAQGRLLDENRTRVEAIADAADSMIDDISDAFGDFVASGFTAFDDMLKSIFDSFKGMLQDMAAKAARTVLRPLVQPVVAAVQGAFSGAGQAAGSAAGAAAGGGGGGWLSAAGGALGTMAGGVAGGIGAFGSAVTGGGFAAISGAVAGAGGLATMAGIATAIGAAIPVIGAVVLAFMAFRKKTVELSKDMKITVETLDASAKIITKGETTRLFGLIKNKTKDVEDATDSMDAYFDSIFKAQEGVMATAASLGIAGSEFDAFVANIKIKLKGLSEEEVQAELAKAFGDLTNQFAGASATIKALNYEGEAYLATLERLAAQHNVVTAGMDLLNLKFTGFSTTLAKLTAEQGLVEAAGGVEALAAGFDAFFQNFRTEAERFEEYTSGMNAALKTVGLALPATRDGFADLVDGLNLNTEAGRNQLAVLLKISALAGEYYTYLEAGTAVTVEASNALKIVNQGLEDMNRSLLSGAHAIKRAQEIVDAAGGEAAAAQGYGTYLTQFRTPAQQAAENLQDVNRALKAVGLTLPATRAEFVKLFNGLDLMSPQGRAQMGVILGVMGIIDSFYDFGEAAVEAAATVNNSWKIVSAGMEQLNVAFIKTTDSAKRLAQATGIVTAAGGEEAAASGFNTYFAQFRTPAQQAAENLHDITKALKPLSLTLPTTRAGFVKLFDSLDASSLLGQKRIGELLKQMPLIDSYYDYLEGLPGAIKDTGDAAEQAAEALKKLNESITEAERDRSEVLRELESRYRALTSAEKALADVRKGLAASDLAPGNEMTQFAELKQQFATAAAAAMGGDVDAAAEAGRLAQAVLSQGQSIYAGSASYGALFKEVNATLVKVGTALGAQADKIEPALGAEFFEEVSQRTTNQLLAALAQLDKRLAALYAQQEKMEKDAAKKAARDASGKAA